MNNKDCKQREEVVSGNIFIRPVHLDKTGDVLQGHTHNFDHTSFFVQGDVKLELTTPDGEYIETKEFHAPAFFLIKANVRHQITALTDDVIFWCVYSHRNAQGEIVEETDTYNAYQ